MGMHHKEEKENYIHHLLTLINEGTVPSALSAAKSSLLKKVLDEKARFETEFVDDDEILKMPSMGVLKVSHEVLDEHKYLFATDIRTRHQTRVQLYSAHQMKSDGSVVKGELLNDVVMSEKQFADLLVNTNRGIGYPVTMEKINGRELEAYDYEQDPTKETMSNLRQRIGSTSSQIDRFLKEAEELLANAEEKGRMGKADAKEMASLMTMLPGHLMSNSSHDIEILNTEMLKRVNEATLNTHFAVNSLKIEG